MDYLPLFTKLENRDCLVVGGGQVALRKARMLRRAGAIVTAVAPEIGGDLQDLVKGCGGQVLLQGYSAELLDGKALVVAATDEQAVNQQVSTDAQARQLPVNVVDQPELCTVILPAIIDRSPIVVAVSSGGKSPVLARMLRSRIETMVPSAYGRLGGLAARFRDAVKQRFDNIDDRRNFWESTLQGPIAEMVFAGKDETAAQMLAEELERGDPPPSGEVYLVGAGPGDPDLLTFKALRLMQKADVVLYDRLVAPEIVELCRQDAERIYVGKARSNHSLPQEEINALLVKLAQQGKRVVRLKGGDPFIFGRGGEEIDLLAEHKVLFQVVPGITAASGCANYSGIPLTHRDYAQSVRFVTGHLKDNTMDLPWSELVHSAQTVVFYMGLMGLPIICGQLVAHGRAPETPIALIQQGTTAKHKVLVGTLSSMVEQVAKNPVKAPTLIIVGEVVSLREKLAWYENQA